MLQNVVWRKVPLRINRTSNKRRILNAKNCMYQSAVRSWKSIQTKTWFQHVNVDQTRKVYLNYCSRKALNLKTLTSYEISKDQKLLSLTAQNFTGHLHTCNFEKASGKHYCVVRQERSMSSSRTSIRKAIMTQDA